MAGCQLQSSRTRTAAQPPSMQLQCARARDRNLGGVVFVAIASCRFNILVHSFITCYNTTAPAAADLIDFQRTLSPPASTSRAAPLAVRVAMDRIAIPASGRGVHPHRPPPPPVSPHHSVPLASVGLRRLGVAMQSRCRAISQSQKASGHGHCDEPPIRASR